jgi:hypothetical protein
MDSASSQSNARIMEIEEDLEAPLLGDHLLRNQVNME